jgi:hypothetical protein
LATLSHSPLFRSSSLGFFGIPTVLEAVGNPLDDPEFIFELSEQHEEWSTGRKYLTMDEFYQWKASLQQDDDTEGSMAAE